MAGETGFEINMEGLQEAINKAEKSIKDLAKTTNTQTKSIVDSFNDLSKNGLGSFVQKLNEATSALDKFGKGANTGGFKEVKNEVKSTVDEVVRLTNTLNDLKKADKLKIKIESEKLNTKQELNNIKELTYAEAERRRELERQSKADAAAAKKRESLAIKEVANETRKLMNIEKQKERQLKEADMRDQASHKERTMQLRQQIKEIERLAKAYRTMPATISVDKANELRWQSRDATTINQRITAVHNLKNALKDLDTTTKEGKKAEQLLTNEIARQQKELQKLGINLDSVKKKKRTLINYADQLRRGLALVFSLSQIKNYIVQLVKIRAEFEMQQRSLEVLLQSKDEANKLWSQTVQLAVKSPFTVKELITYTKQLAAYRIESDKLFETNKMLADVSAGLGVDMQRLILAFGQVKAANYLRGTELRQFSEAGVNMLGELAKYFSEIEKRGVTVGEVFQRISKRMVDFGDVEEVFRRITSEGGLFYQMQEKQSETTLGMWRNLIDSLHLMFNEIGQGNDGVIKNFINSLKNIVTNWQTISNVAMPILGALITRFAVLKLSAIAFGEVNFFKTLIPSLMAVRVQLNGLRLGVKQATIHAQTFAKSMGKGVSLAGGWATILSAVVLAIWGIVNAVKAARAEQEKYNKIIDEEKQTLDKKTNGYNRLVEQLKMVNKGSAEHRDIIKQLNAEYGEYLSFVITESTTYKELAKNATKVNQTLSDKARLNAYEKIYEEKTKELIEKRVDTEEKIDEEISKIRIKEEGGLSFKLTEKDADTILRYIEKNIKSFGDGKYGEAIKKEQYKAIYKELGLNYSGNDELNQLLEDYVISLKTEQDMQRDLTQKLNKTFSSGESLPAVLRNRLEQLENEEKVALARVTSTVEKEKIRYEYALKRIAAEKEYFKQDDEWEKKQINLLEKKTATQKDINNKILGLKDKIGQEGIDLIYIDEGKSLKGIEELAKEYAESYKFAKEQNETLTKLRENNIAINEEEFESNEKRKTAYLEFLKLIRMEDLILDKKGSKGKDWYLELAKGVSEYHKDVLKNNKKMDIASAKTLAWEQNMDVLKSALKGVGLTMDWLNNQEIDFSKEDGVIGLLNTIKSLPKITAEQRIEIEKIISNIEGEATINISIGEVESAERELENMFSNYEMTMELESEGLDSDYFLDLFGLRKVSADDIQKAINEKLGDLKLTGDFNNDELIKYISENKEAIGEDYADLYIKTLENLNDKEIKLLQERVKNNMKYAKQALTTIGQIRLSEIQEINAINNEYDAEIERAKGDTERIEKLNADKERALKGVKDKSEKDVNKALWEEFKGSEGFIRIFQDAEYSSNRAINNMLSELEKLKGGMSDMNVDEIKAIADAMEKLENIKMERFPMVEMFKAMGDLRQQKLGLDNISTDTVGDVEGIKAGSITNRKQLRKAIEKYDKAIADERSKQKGITDEGALKASDATIESLIKQKEKLEEVEEQGKDAYARLKEGFGKFGGKINEVGQSLGVFQSSLENMGVNFSDGMKDALGTAQEVLGGIGTMAQGIASGNYLQALMGLFQTLGALFQIGDKRKERQIQDNIKAIEKLGKAYEKLEKKIEEAYSIETLQSATNMAMDNLEEQIRRQEEIIALEQAKKKSDEDKLDDYRDELDSQMEQLEEMKKEVVSKATDGAFDDVLSVADEFVDAWLTAFQETGDGLQGLEDNFNEFMLNIIKRQASMQIVGAYADKWKEQLEKYVNANDTKLTTDEALKFAESVKADMPELSEALKAYFEAMKGVVDIDGQGDTMSGLQRGIHELSESTGEVIAAYLDSLRFYVADNNTQLKQFLQNYNASANTYLSPILTQVTNIANDTSEIKSLLSSIISTYTGNAGGKGVKMIM